MGAGHGPLDKESRVSPELAGELWIVDDPKAFGHDWRGPDQLEAVASLELVPFKRPVVAEGPDRLAAPSSLRTSIARKLWSQGISLGAVNGWAFD